MLYTSTRNNQINATSAEAIVQGLSLEGGLFVPQDMPTISADELNLLAGMDYIARADYILSKFLTAKGGWASDDVQQCAAAAYTGTFRHADVAPVVALDDNTDVLELYHGPTCAFKDMALQIMPRLLTRAAQREKPDRELCILVATSGDTGKAALEGFADVPGTRIVVYYPDDGVSPVQKRQMTTQAGENVRVVAVRGNFDDTQNGVKAIFGDSDFVAKAAAEGTDFTSANSINWGRLVPQIVYYFSAYCDLMNSKKITLGEAVNFVVPTGNFGNILAGWYAKQMGLPVHKLVCASNQNRVLADFFAGGTYDRNRPFFCTSSPSMDILISSNLERLLFLLSGQDSAVTADWMQQLAKQGSYVVPVDLLAKLQTEFFGSACDEQQCAAAIAKAWQQQGYLSDPHTAVALHVLDEYRAKTGDQTRSVVVSTASPFKFAGSVLAALGKTVPENEFEALDLLAQVGGVEIPAPLCGLQEKAERFTEVCDKEDMVRYI
ncbi:MAG: threonine synthase [Oscillospiraceae bacterium]|nr:threonine synthase [Oscillospiraceae bacterium]